jgi:hypothetical protein
MRQRRDAALRSLRLMLVASILLFCYASWTNYWAAFDNADERIGRFWVNYTLVISTSAPAFGISSSVHN